MIGQKIRLRLQQAARKRRSQVTMRSIDMLLILMVTFFGISFILTSLKPIVTNANLTSMAKIIIEDVEFRGIVDAETTQLIQNKLSDFNLADKDPTWSFSGSIKPSGKIQLQDEFTFTITVTEQIVFSNLTGEPIAVDIPITKTLKGVSQNYYRASEL